MNRINENKMNRMNSMNVKPKFLKVMKQKIFTLMMMLALVIVAGKAFAQGSSQAPYCGVEETYSWLAITCDGYMYYVTDDAVSPTNDPTDGSMYDVTTGALDHSSDALSNAASAAVGITWTADADGGTFYVWISAESADGCNNYRYVVVQPTNEVDFILAALGIYPEDVAIATLESAAADNGGDDCPEITDRYQAVYDSDGSVDDGDVFVYFRVTENDNNPVDTWTITFGASTGTIQYSTGGAWADYTAPLTALADNEIVLFRVRIDTPLSTAGSAVEITGTISDGEKETLELVDSESSNDEFAYTVNRVAAIGGFSGS